MTENGLTQLLDAVVYVHTLILLGQHLGASGIVIYVKMLAEGVNAVQTVQHVRTAIETWVEAAWNGEIDTRKVRYACVTIQPADLVVVQVDVSAENQVVPGGIDVFCRRTREAWGAQFAN